MKILLRCDLDSPSGYSAHARALIDSLGKIPEVDLKVEPAKHDRVSVPIDPALMSYYRSLVQKEWTDPDVYLQFETAELYRRHPRCYNIGFTMWETTSIPDEWVPKMNGMDEIWTASSDASQAFVSSGVLKPVQVFPGPVDTNYGYVSPLELVGPKVRPFTIGLMAQWNRRKNIEDWLVWIFSQFERGEVLGVLKTYGNFLMASQARAVLERVELIKKQVAARNPAQVIVMTETLDDLEVSQWMRSVDLYVSFSRGEGLCLPALQAMASGVPVAHTDFGGPRDYLRDPEGGMLLRASLEPVTGTPPGSCYRSDQWWARVDLHDATRRVRQFMGLTAEAKAAMGEAARKHVVDHCSVEAISSRIGARLRELPL